MVERPSYLLAPRRHLTQPLRVLQSNDREYQTFVSCMAGDACICAKTRTEGGCSINRVAYRNCADAGHKPVALHLVIASQHHARKYHRQSGNKGSLIIRRLLTRQPWWTRIDLPIGVVGAIGPTILALTRGPGVIQAQAHHKGRAKVGSEPDQTENRASERTRACIMHMSQAKPRLFRCYLLPCPH